ncbi:ras GEF [Pyrrhoderma noxium]|uniref:Ras GEF n=1 Tax=Pyrrhoderma noxium TaxID=2282107 RepID=A0A286UNG1_9AGAM|nr:ras GEF [Pyrrhoderma noxium]
MSENTLHPSNNNHAPSFPQIPPPHIPKPISESRSEPLDSGARLDLSSLGQGANKRDLIAGHLSHDISNMSGSAEPPGMYLHFSHPQRCVASQSLYLSTLSYASNNSGTLLVPRPPSRSGRIRPGLRTLVQRVKRHSRHSGPQTNFSEDDIESSPYEDSEFEQGYSGEASTQIGRRILEDGPTRSRKSTGAGAHPPLANINTSINVVPSVIPENSPPLRTKASAPTPLDSNRSRHRKPSEGRYYDESSHRWLKGCGKSAFMRRAWKNARISEQTRHTVSAKDSDGTRVIHYNSRKAYMQAHEGRDYFLTLIEISIQELEHVDGEIHGDVWPSVLPKIDGAFVLYDASDRSSFIHIEELIHGYYKNRIPYIVLACKSDLPHLISPADSSNVASKYDGGIVEISNNEAGRDKTKRCVGVLLRGVCRRRWGDVNPDLNPCSPGLYNAPAPWELNPSPSRGIGSSTNIPSPNHNAPTRATVSSSSSAPPPPPPTAYPTKEFRRQPPPPQIPLVPLLLIESIVDLTRSSGKSTESINPLAQAASPEVEPALPEPGIPMKKEFKQSPPAAPWLTIEELLEKLFFLSCSGNDPSFISHFFLTCRRFTTPRKILLAMQKRMLELNQPSNDYTLAAYAQLRICTLLEQWIHDHPTDFAVPGTAGALQALIKQILRQPHTLYYGSDFLPFLEILPTLQDQDSSWAVKVETIIADSDESDNDSDAVNPARPITRERKSSIPLSAKNFLSGNLPATIRTVGSISPSPRDTLSRLVKASNGILHVDSEELAREITRRELDLYMRIESRDWLRHTLVSGKKDPNSDRIARFNTHYNDLHDWAASMILCHDKPKSRARVVEKLAEVAVRLRNLNNYSGLRAIITAITQSTYPNDEVMEIFKQKTELHKKYLSSDILMRTSGAHQSYRMALKNTKGPCIPCLEIHTSDLRRAHEGNPDHKSDDPTKIHWAKFNMIGKFVTTTTQLQNNCRGQHGYGFVENPQIAQYFDIPVLDYDAQQDRLGPPPEDDGDVFATPLPPALALDHSGHSKDSGIVRRKVLSMLYL